LDQQKLAVECGTWPLYRFDPRREAPFQLDSAAPKVPVARYLENELRFRMIEKTDPERYRTLQAAAQADAERRWKLHQNLADHAS
jgi:pyruvate-ferredoxin/flavodoxin oxidoreductase